MSRGDTLIHEKEVIALQKRHSVAFVLQPTRVENRSCRKRTQHKKTTTRVRQAIRSEGRQEQYKQRIRIKTTRKEVVLLEEEKRIVLVGRRKKYHQQDETNRIVGVKSAVID